jgi:hypothetical protein
MRLLNVKEIKIKRIQDKIAQMIREFFDRKVGTMFVMDKVDINTDGNMGQEW